MYQNLNKLCYLFFTILSTLSYNAFSQVNVTFKVDMQYQAVSENGVHIAGSMQDWNPATTPLTDTDGNGIWEVTLELDEFNSYEYKFINGNSWGSDEQVFGDCGAGNGNRYLDIAGDDLVLPAYLFNSCDITVYGCTDIDAINYDSSANNEDGSCVYPENGCTDISACNYDANATEDDGSCEYANIYYDCDGTCLADADGDGVCDELEVPGCTDMSACNYDSSATEHDSSCTYPPANYDCDGNCIDTPIDWIGDQDEDGFISYDEYENVYISVESFPNTGSGILILNGESYSMNYSDWGSNAHWYYMISANEIPMEYTWEVVVSNECGEGQSISGLFVSTVSGCMDEAACNYNTNANNDNGTCLYPDDGLDCDGNSLNLEGCTYLSASNYNSNAFIDDGSCLFELIEDLDGDGHDDSSFSAGVLSVECPEIIESCLGDLNNDGTIATGDLLVFLGQFGLICE